ncbi:MAG TPA: hypothetical protein VFE93_06560, partial [Myxococcaceae bacterium]|nr:hypothetical protein [Myxococcaceae bacterium]
MPTPDYAAIRLGDQVYTAEGTDPIGAVRELRSGPHPALIVYIENVGDIAVPVPAIRAVHDGKVVLDPEKLEDRVRKALGHVR